MFSNELLNADIGIIQNQINPIVEEKTLLASVVSFVSRHGKDAFLNAYSLWEIKFTSTRNGEVISSTSPLLFGAVHHHYYFLAEKLLSLGIDANGATNCQLWDSLHQISPLMRAITHHNFAMVKLLINHGANLLHKDGLNNNILMHGANDISEEIGNYILLTAKEKNCFNLLLSIVNKFQNECIGSSIAKKKITLLKLVLAADPDWMKRVDIKTILNEARRISFDAGSAEEFKAFDEICSIIKSFPAYALQETPVVNRFGLITQESSYADLFNEVAYEPRDQISALKKVMSEIYYLFRNPGQSLEFLDFLNTEFKRFYKEAYQEDFPVADKDHKEQIQYVSIDGVLFPIPKSTEYIKLGKKTKLGKKNNALEQFFKKILEDHGLAKHVWLWIGFLPHDIADAMARDGDFFKESAYGIGLLHGKLAHVWQMILVILYYKAKLLSHTYYDANSILQTITLPQIAAAFIDLKEKGIDALWMPLRDRRHTDEINICDPYHFTSFLMRERADQHWLKNDLYAWQALTDSMVDSFCNNFIKLYKALREICHQENNLNFDTLYLATCLNDLEIRFFDMKSLTKYAIAHAKNFSVHHSDYAVTTKNYQHDHPNFSLKPYGGSLFHVVMSDQSHIIPKLYAEGIDPNQLFLSSYKNYTTGHYIKHTAFTLAAKEAKFDCLSALIRYPNININAQDSEGKTALYHVLYESNLTMVNYLLEQPGIDPTIGSFISQGTPLNLAIQTHPGKFAKLLAKTPDTSLNMGFFANVYILCQNLNSENLKTFKSKLTKNGLIPLPDTIENFTLLQHAIAYGRDEIVKQLLKRGVSLEVSNGLDVFTLAKLFKENKISELLQTHAKQNRQSHRTLYFFLSKENNVHSVKEDIFRPLRMSSLNI